MERLSVLCFAGTYALALLSDLARLLFRARVRWIWTVALIALGLIVHTAYLLNRGLSSRTVPITTYFESMLVLGWVLAAIALYLAIRSTRARPTVAGLCVLGLALGAVSIAGLWAPRGGSRALWRDALSFWGSVHGLFQVAGAVFTCLAFVFGVMYLAQANRLKHKRSSESRFSLPSLELSERWHRAAITLAFPLLTAGLLTGVGLVVATQRAGLDVLRWTDPKILSTFAVWLVFAVLLHARYRPDWKGREVMFLTVLAFAFLAFAMVGVGLIFPTSHRGLSALQDARETERALPTRIAP